MGIRNVEVMVTVQQGDRMMERSANSFEQRSIVEGKCLGGDIADCRKTRGGLRRVIRD